MEPHRIRRLIGPIFLLALGLTGLSWVRKGRLAEPSLIDPALLQKPVQSGTRRARFSFEYKGRECRVEPVASYEIWGLVVSHNNIHSMADIYHDSTSVDTKDLCVIWGSNLESPEYRRVQYKSGPFTCYFSYPDGVRFSHLAIGNNHLITDSEAIRRQLDRVRVGDQVHLSGLLVNYQMDDWQDFWRKTSTRRDDNDCEVMFVGELQVIARGTPGWYALYRLGWLLLLALPVAYVFLMWIEAGRPNSTTLGRL